MVPSNPKDSFLTLTGGNILPVIAIPKAFGRSNLADVEGWQEYGLLKKP